MLKQLRDEGEDHITGSGVCSFLHPVFFIADYISSLKRIKRIIWLIVLDAGESKVKWLHLERTTVEHREQEGSM